MSFRDFKFPAVVDDLKLGYQEDHLFPNLAPAEISPDLVRRVTIGLELAQGLNCEKGRSEFVIAPFLLDLWTSAGNTFGLFSGYELSIDSERGLNGVCDFLLSRGHFLYLLRAPVLAVVEAKNDNVNSGFGQCIATMLAARMFNEKSGRNGPVYGLSTTGAQWKFFRLDGDVLTLDRADYNFPGDIGLVAAALLRIVA